MEQMFIEKYAEEWCDKHYKKNPEEWTAAYAGFVAGAKVHQQNFCKPACSTLREIIEQNLNNVISHDKYNITPDMELVSKTKQSTYRYLLKIIDELQPVA